MSQFALDPNPFDASGVQFAWNSTSLKLTEECMYKYKLTMLEGWQSPTLSAHLRFGQHYASALEHFHQHVAAGMDREEATIEVVWEALKATWDRTENDPEGAPWVSDHNLKTRDNLIRTIVWYLDHFADDVASTIILSDGTPAVEFSFALPVDNDVVFAGHLDRFVEYAHKPYVQDQKTTGSTITQRYFEGYSPDTQMSMYTFAGKAIYNIPISGVMIDAAQIAVGFSRFERGFTPRSESQLNEWYDSAMHTIERARTATRENYFPMNTTACGNYGGCPFRQMCSRAPEVREQFLKSTYVQAAPMNPLGIR